MKEKLPRNIEHQWAKLNPAIFTTDELGRLSPGLIYAINKGDVDLKDALIWVGGREDLKDDHNRTSK